MNNYVSYDNAETLMTAIANKLATVNGAYVFRGSVTFANLPSTITKSMIGYVYNVTDDFTTTADFVEGAGKKYHAGVNVAICKSGDTYTLVTPAGTEDPSAEGWYVLNGADYELTTDTTVQSGTDYYVRTDEFKFDVLGDFINVDNIMTEIDKVVTMIDNNGEFDETSAYEIGDVVTYERGLYRFTSAHTANDPWDVAEVEVVDVLTLIDEAEPESLTTAQVNALIALLD